MEELCPIIEITGKVPKKSKNYKDKCSYYKNPNKGKKKVRK